MKLNRSISFDRGPSASHHLFLFHPKNQDFCIQVIYDDEIRRLQLYFVSREFRTIGPLESEQISFVVNHILYFIWRNIKL